MIAAAVGAGLAGLVLGSFANVVTHRVPRRESVVRPASRCPSCSAAIPPRDNVPVLSWLLLGGRCRRCRAPISLRYPLLELATAALFVLAVLRLPPDDLAGHTRWDLLAYLPLLWVLVPLSAIDLEHKLLPNRIVVPSIVAVAALLAVAGVLGPGIGAWVRALAGGAASFGFFLVLALISPRGMGMGDVKLAAVLGLGLGYLSWERVFVGFFVAFAAAAVVGIALMIAGRAGRKTQMPFGPWLALGTAVSVLAGGPIVEAWLGS